MAWPEFAGFSETRCRRQSVPGRRESGGPHPPILQGQSIDTVLSKMVCWGWMDDSVLDVRIVDSQPSSQVFQSCRESLV